MTTISKNLRQQVFERAKRLCEYCQSAQIIIVLLEIDHILPESLGGKTELDNLCVACRSCNAYKKDAIEAIDPQTNTMQPLFNPRQQRWNDHFQWDKTGTQMIGLTAIGRCTIEKLRINDAGMIQARHNWILTGLHPPK
ncbi:MAG TPA: HNH endonuclease signature motif containing protein [Aggregatilineales bacterium]|nr:HNH endonuclease signature motif containing protein [Aggregatilineales bacterium]